MIMYLRRFSKKNKLYNVMDPEVQYCYDNALQEALSDGHIETARFLINQGANVKFIKNPKIRSELGLPKWNKRPNNIVFRDNDECPISGEALNKNTKQLGCSLCKNTFKLDALENWLDINYRCPNCNGSDEFFLL